MLDLEIRTGVSTGRESYGSNPTHALIRLDLKAVRRLLYLSRMIKYKIKVYCIEDWDSSATWLYDPEDSGADTEWTDGSIHCETVKITDDDFHWQGQIKHADTEVFTDGVPIGILKEYVKVVTTKKNQLPLLLTNLKHEENRPVLMDRLKK